MFDVKRVLERPDPAIDAGVNRGVTEQKPTAIIEKIPPDRFGSQGGCDHPDYSSLRSRYSMGSEVAAT